MDFLFIDGDHTYAGVKNDFEGYSKLVKKGGLIAFHDIAPPQTEKYRCQVDKFWNKIKNGYKHWELIEQRSQDNKGIGIMEWTQ